MREDERGLKAWNTVLGGLSKLPGARVNREAYLRAELASHVPPTVLEEAIRTRPGQAGVPLKVIDKLALGAIKYHRALATAKSAAVGIPGGPLVIATVPTDVAQYFYHSVIVSQKLAYLYGWPQLFQDGESDVDDETKLTITLFIGAMMGVQGANQALSKLATALAKQVVKRLPRAALTQYALYQIAKQVAKWIGLRLTKKKFAEMLGRSIPFVGGAIAGMLTWVAFGWGGKRLQSHLRSLALAQA